MGEENWSPRCRTSFGKWVGGRDRYQIITGKRRQSDKRVNGVEVKVSYRNLMYDGERVNTRER